MTKPIIWIPIKPSLSLSFPVVHRHSKTSIGSFRRHDCRCNESVSSKLNFGVGLAFCDYSTLVTSCEMGEVSFHLIGTNPLHVNPEFGRFTDAGSHCRQNLKFENFSSSFCRHVKKLHQRACRTCSTIIFVDSTNHMIHSRYCRCSCRRNDDSNGNHNATNQ